MENRIIKIKRSELCTDHPGTFDHINHQLCQSCKASVPIPLDCTFFANSTSDCDECPEGSTGYNLREMFIYPRKYEVIND